MCMQQTTENAAYVNTYQTFCMNIAYRSFPLSQNETQKMDKASFLIMKVVVENLTGTLFYVQVGNEATVSDLKREIEAQQKLPYDRLILILNTDHDHHHSNLIKDGVDGVSLVDYGVQDGSHVYIFFNPLDDDSTNHLFEF